MPPELLPSDTLFQNSFSTELGIVLQPCKVRAPLNELASCVPARTLRQPATTPMPGHPSHSLGLRIRSPVRSETPPHPRPRGSNSKAPDRPSRSSSSTIIPFHPCEALSE